MTQPRFDPNLIERYAEQLYRKADSVRVGSAIAGAVLGVLFGAAPLSPLGEFLPVPSTFGMATILLGGLVGGFVGYVVGEGRAFRIKLQAQLVLFQLQLERNTAQAAAAPPSSPAPAAAPASAPVAQPAPALPVLPAQPVVAERPALGVVPAPLPQAAVGGLAAPDELAPPLLPPLSP